MNAIRTWSLAAVLVLGGLGAASAAPMSIASGEALGTTQQVVEQAAYVCGPYRCWHRPGWYGYHRWGWHRPWGWRRWYR